MIREALAGRRVAVTGATGFLGTALVERLLRSVPDCELLLLVRASRRWSAPDRARREIFRNDAFRRLRSELGDRFDAEIERRVKVVPGDVSVDGLGLDDEGRSLLAGCATVVHSAARVNFDSPLDAAVEVNLLGPVRVAQVLKEVGSRAHLISVSTAYVAGSRRGLAPEAPLEDTPFSTEVAWRPEVDAARRLRADVEAESRRPEHLARFAREARAELGAAGSPLLSARSERQREQWVNDRLVEAGRARAGSLGWPDSYAYTKALGERALLEVRGSLPVTIVRPSIIESALAEPHAGWIRGFRMAEPVLIAYARGLLKEFPGIPEGVVDVIPVDLVVAAILAVAARGPASPPSDSGQASPAEVYHVATGTRNPLRYRHIVHLVQGYFHEHPLYDSEGQPIVVSEWSFPGRGRVQGQLQRSVTALKLAERALAALPLRGERAEVGARLEERRGQAERGLEYVSLYGAYMETEALFDDRRLQELWAGLDDDDRRTFSFDTTSFDWEHYVRSVHLPSIVRHARVRTGDTVRDTSSRHERGRRAVLNPARHMAAFDLENTLLASNVVESYAWLATRRMGGAERARFTLRMLKQAPWLLALDRRDRGDFLRSFYRRYEDAPAGVLREDAWELFSSLLLIRAFPAGIRRVREHRAAGHRTVLITGALDFVIQPFRPLFDDVVCARVVERDGRLTGELLEGPPTGEARALVMADYASAEGLSLAQSVAYADSASDLPMLEAVGYPVAVNPETKLAAIARRRGWHTEQWSRVAGTPRPLLPLAPRVPATR